MIPRNPVDAALALLFVVAASVEMALTDIPAPAGAKAVAGVLTTAPLAWRTAAPVVTAVTTTCGYALAVGLGLGPEDSLFPLLAPLVAVYSVGAHATIAGMAAATSTAAGALSLAVAATGENASEVALYAGAVAVALVVGGAVRVMGFETEVLEARALELERERDEKARAAVAEERARMARELHDVIGHSISVMGVQAGAVRRLLKPEQERERDALVAVERIGRDAVAEMQRLLGLLRSNGEEPAPGAPLTLRRVDDLVGELRRAGLDVDLRVDGELDGLSPGRALVAFRILQEALTNALKHAPGSHVDAALRRTADAVEIEVVDDGEAPPSAHAGGGHGLLGMRERVALYGGTLEAGPRPVRGFAIRARVPTGGP